MPRHRSGDWHRTVRLDVGYPARVLPAIHEREER